MSINGFDGANFEVFQNYLIKNEQWLTNSNEEVGQHEKDGHIDSDELSIFFNGRGIKLNENNELEGFNNWYNNNSSAIMGLYGCFRS